MYISMVWTYFESMLHLYLILSTSNKTKIEQFRWFWNAAAAAAETKVEKTNKQKNGKKNDAILFIVNIYCFTKLRDWIGFDILNTNSISPFPSNHNKTKNESFFSLQILSNRWSVDLIYSIMINQLKHLGLIFCISILNQFFEMNTNKLIKQKKHSFLIIIINHFFLSFWNNFFEYFYSHKSLAIWLAVLCASWSSESWTIESR